MLRKLRKNEYIINILVCVTAIAISTLTILFTTQYCQSVYDKDMEKKHEISDTLRLLGVISAVLLTTTLIVLSIMMMRRLKNRFYGLYTDYGRILWAFVIIQLLFGISAMIIRAIWVYWDAWNTFWIKTGVRIVIFGMISDIFSFILPMML